MTRRSAHAWLVLVPLAVAVVVSAWRVGAAARSERAARDVTVAREAAGAWVDALGSVGERGRPSADGVLDSVVFAAVLRPLASALDEAGLDVAAYRRTGDGALVRVPVPRSGAWAPDRLGPAIGSELGAGDGAFADRLGGRPVAITPLTDAARSRAVGALVVAGRAPESPLLPIRLLLFGAAAWLAAWWGLKMLDVLGGRVSVAVAGVAYTVAVALMAPPAAGWVVGVMGAWGVLAVLGLRAAGRAT